MKCQFSFSYIVGFFRKLHCMVKRRIFLQVKKNNLRAGSYVVSRQLYVYVRRCLGSMRMAIGSVALARNTMEQNHLNLKNIHGEPPNVLLLRFRSILSLDSCIQVGWPPCIHSDRRAQKILLFTVLVLDGVFRFEYKKRNKTSFTFCYSQHLYPKSQQQSSRDDE